MPSNELLTPKELAELLRVPLYTAWRLARERGVPGVVRVGRYIRFERAAVEDWIAQGGTLTAETHNRSVALDEEFDDSDRDMGGVLLPPEDESFGIDRFNRGDDA